MGTMHYVEAYTSPAYDFTIHREALSAAPGGVLHENPDMPTLTFIVDRDEVDALMDRLGDWPGLEVEAISAGPAEELEQQ